MSRQSGIVALVAVIALLAWYGSHESSEPQDTEREAHQTENPPTVSLTQQFWWQSEYPALVMAVGSADDFSVSTAYRTGPGGISEMKLLLFKKPSAALILKMEFPREAIFTIDPKTGKKIPSQTSPTLTMRDHNLDGTPDDFNLEPRGNPLYEEELTDDGFVKFRNSSEHQSILMQWSVAIGFSINHFLHGIDSAMPR